MISRKSEHHEASLERAESFLLDCIREGLAHSLVQKEGRESWVKPYPEVTGYLLSYFCGQETVDETILKKMANKLLKIQHKSGGFPSFYDQTNLYSFDTAQILHGLLSWYKKSSDVKFLVAAKKAGDFLCSMQVNSGLMFPIYDIKSDTRVVYQNNAKGSDWGSTFSYIQVKNAAALLLLHKITKIQRYLTAAERLGQIKLLNQECRYTHPLAYYLEGMMALGKNRLVKQILEDHIIPRLRSNGFIPYFPGAKYAYVSGSVQLGILLLKVGYSSEAKIIRQWAQKVQSSSSSGGLYQYAKVSGKPDFSIHGEINSWGTKYFAELIRIVN